MEDYIKLKKIIKIKNEVKYQYEISDNIKKYFYPSDFTIKYGENIEEVPNSILAIPFTCNILPIIWITNSTLEIPELDRDFFNSIEEFKKGYINMYPSITFKGNIKVENIIKNEYEDSKQCLCFFSGGVDATSTLITHIKEKPITLTLWGADIKTSNENGWDKVKEFIIENTPNIENKFIKSEFRTIINEVNLNKKIEKYVSENWWHGFQHGIGLIGHAAPLCYIHKITKVYIPSTFTKDDVGVTCASDPTIDNYVRFGSTKVYHDGYEFSRQDKIQRICDYNQKTNNKLKLRVCYMTDKGNNCNECEKCIRTIMAIKANGENPADYGFSPDYKKIKYILENKCYFNNIILPLWNNILEQFNKNKNRLKDDEDVQWFFNIDFNKINKRYLRFYKRVNRFIKRKIGRK